MEPHTGTQRLKTQACGGLSGSACIPCCEAAGQSRDVSSVTGEGAGQGNFPCFLLSLAEKILEQAVYGRWETGQEEAFPHRKENGPKDGPA